MVHNWILFLSTFICSVSVLAGTQSSDIEVVIESMSLRQKVGQLFLIGFQGAELGPRLKDTMETVKPGGVILFGRNIKSARQVSELNSALQRIAMKSSKTPLLIAVDQEGGSVLRIRTPMPLPSARAFGLAQDPLLNEEAGEATGRLLKALGFNLNFAPVLDVGSKVNESPSFLGTRVYCNDPHRVGIMASSFAAGLEKHQIMATGKHFPGHGGLSEDSHLVTPQKHLSLEEMESSDLLPFRMMNERFQDRWSVMMAHVAYPKLDPSGLPATFSRPIVEGVLRKKLGFQGVVVTDDIEMTGAFAIKDPKERAVRAIEAGVDMIMVAWNGRLQRELLSAVEGAVRSGRLDEARIDESVRRILIAKSRVAQPLVQAASDSELRLAIQNPKFSEVASKVVQARFDLSHKPKSLAKPRQIIVFSSQHTFKNQFKASLSHIDVRFTHLDRTQPDLVARTLRKFPLATGVLHISNRTQAALLSQIGGDVTQRLLVITEEPENLNQRAHPFRHFIDLYYRHPKLGRLVAEHFFPANNSVSLRKPAMEKETEEKSALRSQGQTELNLSIAD